MVERNYRAAGAEVDLVVRRGDVVRFVEVKARPGDDERALESIGPHKQRQLRRAAEAWLVDNDVGEIAFLVAWVQVQADGRYDLVLIDDAF